MTVLALVGLFAGVGWSTVFRAGLGETERSDFTVYQAAGRAILDGTPLYEAKNVRGWLYMYLPIFAVLMVPLAVLPKTVGAGAWFLLSLACLLHLIAVSARLADARAGPSRLGRFWVGVAVLVLTGWPWMSGLTRGQASVMLSWLTIVSIDLFLRDERERPKAIGPRWAGAFALALATTIRIFPVMLGIWLVLQRKWRALFACLVAGVALTIVVPGLVFGPVRNAELIHHWVTHVAIPTGDAAAETNPRYEQMMDPRIAKNQSVQAVLIRWLSPREEAGRDAKERLARQIAAGLNAGLIVSTLIACGVGAWRRRASDDPALPLLQAAAISMLLLFVPPVSWAHNYSLMALPLAICVACATKTTSGRATGRLPASASGGQSRTLADKPPVAHPDLGRRRVYQIAGAMWLLFAASAFIPAAYRSGAFLLGALCVWAALIADLAGAPAGDRRDAMAQRERKAEAEAHPPAAQPASVVVARASSPL